VAGGMESASNAPYLLPEARWGTRIGPASVLDGLLVDADEEAFWQTGELPRMSGPIEEVDRSKSAEDHALTSCADGAAVLLLARGAAVPADSPRTRVLASALVSQDSSRPSSGLVCAIQEVLRKTDLCLDEVDQFELDWASQAQALALFRDLPDLDTHKVNKYGGSLALGRPLGAQGAHLLVTLLHGLELRRLRYGLAAVGLFGGHSAALLLERQP